MIQDISRTVAKARGVSWFDLMGQSKKRKTSHARQEAIWLARNLTSASYPEISRHFRRHHTTAIHAYDAVKARMQDSDYRHEVMSMLAELTPARPVFRSVRAAQ